MRNLFLLILAGFLASCEKTYVEPETSAPPPPLPYFLDFSGAGIQTTRLEQVSCKDLYSGQTDIGDLPRFETDSFMLQVPIQDDTGEPTYATGIIDGKTFILFCDSGYMNICNGGQHIPVHFNVYQ